MSTNPNPGAPDEKTTAKPLQGLWFYLLLFGTIAGLWLLVALIA